MSSSPLELLWWSGGEEISRSQKRIQRGWYLWSKVQGPRSLLAPPPAYGFGGLEGIPAGRQGLWSKNFTQTKNSSTTTHQIAGNEHQSFNTNG